MKLKFWKVAFQKQEFSSLIVLPASPSGIYFKTKSENWMTRMSFLQVTVTLGGFLLLRHLRMLLQESVAASVARCSFKTMLGSKKKKYYRCPCWAPPSTFKLKSCCAERTGLECVTASANAVSRCKRLQIQLELMPRMEEESHQTSPMRFGLGLDPRTQHDPSPGRRHRPGSPPLLRRPASWHHTSV